MATETRSQEGFGQVSRTVGIVFKYVLLAATLLGIVALGVLLVYVSLDAIQPFTADPGYYLVFFLTFVLPTVGTWTYLSYRNSAGRTVGVNALIALVGGLFVGSAVAVLFIDIIPPLGWLGYVVGVTLPAVAYLGYRRLRPGGGFYERTLVFLALFAYSLFGIPGYIHSAPEMVVALPVVPTEWTILLVTLGVPLGGAIGLTLRARYEDDRVALAALGGTLVVGAIGAVGGGLVGLTPVPGTLLALSVVVPTGTYAAVVVRDRTDARVGLLLPTILVGGMLVGALVTDVAGLAGPQSWVDWDFLTNSHSNTAANAGLYPALVGSVVLMVVVIALSFPVGVGAAVYLEEYAPDNRWKRIIQVNISNLAGVPSVVYGLLGLGVFVKFGGFTAGGVLAGGMTLSLLILPIVIISAQEAIRSVPSSMRQASYGMGATRWQTIKNVVLPEAFPGILTGTILALGRAIGETAPLLMVGVPNIVSTVPTSLTDKVSAMPMQVYSWATVFASEAFYTTAVAAGVIVLLVVVLTMNSIAIVLRNRYQSER